DAQRKSRLDGAVPLTRGGCERDIINFRVRAPASASGNRDFELARQIVELRVASQFAINGQSQRRCVHNLMRIQTRNGAAGDVARDVAASASRRQTNLPKRLQ